MKPPFPWFGGKALVIMKALVLLPCAGIVAIGLASGGDVQQLTVSLPAMIGAIGVAAAGAWKAHGVLSRVERKIDTLAERFHGLPCRKESNDSDANDECEARD